MNKKIKASFYGVERHIRYSVHGSCVRLPEDEWRYPKYYIEKERFIAEIEIDYDFMMPNDCIVIDGVSHEITKRTFTVGESTVKFNVRTILDTIEDEDSEKSKELSRERAKKVIAYNKKQKEEREKIREEEQLNDKKENFFSRFFV